ncbi:class I lanthipeptide [uncultured Kordia sp.]|uniref:class I lanthipeptide n=1 Tax=uncultured Kordia sp. TaxID=507699 RepID=UPI00262F2BBE|nr:class I lanthipeptide [uncultured Kordia sp.]
MKKKVSIQLKLNKRSVSSLDQQTQERIRGGSYGGNCTGGTGGSGSGPAPTRNCPPATGNCQTNTCPPQTQLTCYTYTYPNPTYWWDCVYG